MFNKRLNKHKTASSKRIAFLRNRGRVKIQKSQRAQKVVDKSKIKEHKSKAKPLKKEIQLLQSKIKEQKRQPQQTKQRTADKKFKAYMNKLYSSTMRNYKTNLNTLSLQQNQINKKPRHFLKNNFMIQTHNNKYTLSRRKKKYNNKAYCTQNSTRIEEQGVYTKKCINRTSSSFIRKEQLLQKNKEKKKIQGKRQRDCIVVQQQFKENVDMKEEGQKLVQSQSQMFRIGQLHEMGSKSEALRPLTRNQLQQKQKSQAKNKNKNKNNNNKDIISLLNQTSKIFTKIHSQSKTTQINQNILDEIHHVKSQINDIVLKQPQLYSKTQQVHCVLKTSKPKKFNKKRDSSVKCIKRRKQKNSKGLNLLHFCKSNIRKMKRMNNREKLFKKKEQGGKVKGKMMNGKKKQVEMKQTQKMSTVVKKKKRSISNRKPQGTKMEGKFQYQSQFYFRMKDNLIENFLKTQEDTRLSQFLTEKEKQELADFIKKQ